MVGMQWAAACVAFSAAVLAAPSSSPKKVPGKAFDRIAIVWFENTDYDKAAGDPNFAALAKQGITFSNYYGVTHPSQPNYIASISGDHFGMNHDDLTDIPSNVSTVIDLLEDRGITWGEYQEDMPSVGFTGLEFQNPNTHANDYVRKHNPAVSYVNINSNKARLANTKPLTSFAQDLKNNALPQWMFITPNMTSDGHDSSVTTAGEWAKTFVTPLLKDKNFMQRTLLLLTFDEDHTYTTTNRVLGMALGDAIPQNLVGTTDDTFYDHYSEAATVEANWCLHTLGRYDVGANVFKFVAAKTGDKSNTFPEVTGSNPTVFLNDSYPGAFNDKTKAPIPAPNTKLQILERTVLPKIVKAWGKIKSTPYQGSVKIPDAANPQKAH